MAAGVAGRQASPLVTDVCDLRFSLTNVFIVTPSLGGLSTKT